MSLNVFLVTQIFSQWVKLNLPPTASSIATPSSVNKNDMWVSTFFYFDEEKGKPLELIHVKDEWQGFSQFCLG